jgi:O-antigen/teichoic acid export membrane protein
MTDAQVGIYSLASVLAEGAIQIAVVVQNNLNPVIAKALARKDDAGHAEVHAIVQKTRRWFIPALSGLCLVSALLYPVIIPFLIGDPAFEAGAWSYAILVGGIALASPWLAFNQVLLMASRPGWHTIFVLLAVALNFVGNVLLIPRMGMEGAATATAVTLVVSMVLLVRIARTRAGVRL